MTVQAPCGTVLTGATPKEFTRADGPARTRSRPPFGRPVSCPARWYPQAAGRTGPGRNDPWAARDRWALRDGRARSGIGRARSRSFVIPLGQCEGPALVATSGRALAASLPREVIPSMPLTTAAAVRHSRSCRIISALVTITTVTAAGCGGNASAAGPVALEKPDIVIGVPSAISSAALFIAQDDGLFQKAGLRVKIEALGASGPALPELLRGQADVLEYPWTAAIEADATGAARLRAIAAAQSLGPLLDQILVLR